MPAARRVTIHDVAERAQVSLATVSRALNGRGDVSAPTRSRVVDAARELGFRPARAATAAATSAQQLTVGMLTSDSVGRFSIPVMLGAEDALGAGSVAVLLCDARGDAIREQHYLRVLVERQVDGIIVVGQSPDPRPPVHPTVTVPVVYAYAPSQDPQDVSLVPDDGAGAELVTRHLLDGGRTRIAHITGPVGRLAARTRADGMRRALAAAGLEPVTDVLHGEWSRPWGRQAAAALLRRAPETDAIFCGSDEIAAGVMDTLRDAGRSVPGDVAVAGFDNWDVYAVHERPPLTTVDMDLEVLGRLAAQELFRAMQGGTPRPGTRALPCRVVVRESTAVAAPAPAGRATPAS